MTLRQAFESHLDAGGISDGRRREYRRFLNQLDAGLDGRPLVEATAEDVVDLLKTRQAAGIAPSTLRKERCLAAAFFSWSYFANYIDADTLLAVKAIRPPAGESGRIQPNPYTPKEMRKLWAVMQERWPKLEVNVAQRRVERWRRGTGSLVNLPLLITDLRGRGRPQGGRPLIPFSA